MKTLLFVSKDYGAQEFVTYSDGSSVAIVGNAQRSKVRVQSPVKRAKLSEVTLKINQLRDQGVKLLDSYKDSYNDLNEALDQVIDSNSWIIYYIDN